MTKKKKPQKADIAAELTTAFEQCMYHLSLLGNKLPKSAEGLTSQQLRVLFILAYAEGPLTMAKAASRVGVAPGTLTEGVKRLVKGGLIERRRGAEDDRIVELSLSDAGKSLTLDIRNCRVEFFREITSALDDATCRALIASHQLITATYARILNAKQGASQ